LLLVGDKSNAKENAPFFNVGSVGFVRSLPFRPIVGVVFALEKRSFSHK